MNLVSINPATGKPIKTYKEMKLSEVEQTIQKNQKAFLKWKNKTINARSQRIKKAAQILLKNKNQYARMMTMEMGKPIKQAKLEIEKCALICDYYTRNAHHFLKPIVIPTEAQKSYVSFEPIGILLAIMPWNFPFWQVFRAAIPALMAGNTILLKHAANVTGCALAIENIFKKAGLQNHFQTLVIHTPSIKNVIEHPLVKAITLTGSTQAGKAVASLAGNALKKTVLELGGSDPYIILDDADIDQAVSACVYSRLINAGQSCIAAKRFIVIQTIQKKFEEKFLALMKTHTLGNPLNEKVTVGPMARMDLRDELHNQVQMSIQKGARLLLGGKTPDMPGAYYPPTILTNVKKGMPVYDQETFGPVAAIISAKNKKHAIQIANDSVFGLGASVFTKNTKSGEYIAQKELEAGAVFVNTFVRSDPRLPFGGIKESGYGRELSYFGMHEFVNIKTVYIGK